MRVRSAVIALCVGLFAVVPLSAQSDLEAFVDSLAADHIDAGRLAGIGIGVATAGETVLLKGYGFADLEWDVPMPANAIFEIGSVTKQFTSAALMQLWADGKLDLDADITTYLPDFDTQGREIPVRRLFDHTSGIKGYTEMRAFGGLATQALPADTLVALVEAEPLEFEPGTALIYNNSAYFLLGLMIEEISGQSYAEYLEEHVFPLAGMDDSSYCTNDEVWKRRAHGYAPGEDGLDRAAYLDHRWPYSAGSLCSTVGDLVSWNQALHGGQIVSSEGYQLMTTPMPLVDGTPTRYAMGLTNYQAASGHIIEHGGGINGFLSQSRYYPEHDAVIVVLLNTTGPPGPAAIADAIGEHMFGGDHLPGGATFQGDLSQFVGKYRGPARGTTLTATVTVDDGVLMLQANGPTAPYEYLEGTTFFRGNSRLIFEVNESGAHTARLDQIGGHYVLARVDEEAEAAARPSVPEDVLRRYAGSYELRPGVALLVTLEDGTLRAQLPGQSAFALLAVTQTDFQLDGVEAGLEFVVDENDEVTGAIMKQGGQERRVTRIPG